MMALLKNTNLGLAFLLELVAIAAFAYWGFNITDSTVLMIVLGVGTPILAIVLWGIFAAPKSERRLEGTAYLVFKVVFFVLAILALIVAGSDTLGILFPSPSSSTPSCSSSGIRTPARGWPEFLAHQIELGDQRGADFARLGVATERLLRENQFAVDFDFEAAAGRGNQCPGGDKMLDLALADDFVRQGGNTLLIATGRAVGQFHIQLGLLHFSTPCNSGSWVRCYNK